MKRLLPLVALAALAGCGGGAEQTAPPVLPKLPPSLASAWRAQADGVASALAAGDGCEAQRRALALQAAVIDAVNARRVAPRFQETLLSSVNDLAGRIGCTTAAPTPTPTVHGNPHESHGHGHGQGHGKHGKGDD